MTLPLSVERGGGRGIDWRVVGGDAAAGHRHAVQSVTSRTPQATYTVTSMPSSLAGQTMYQGVLLPDGRVYFVPLFGTAKIYDPSSNTVTIPAGTFGSTGVQFAAGVLLFDGRVFLAPRASTTAYLYDPLSNAVTAASGTYPGGDANAGAVVMRDGRVFMAPFAGAFARIYDPSSDTMTVAASNFSFGANASFWGAVLMLDGRVFICPLLSTTARIYDPVTNTVSTPGGTYPGSLLGGTLLPDGRVYCVPFNSTTARIYNPTTNTVSTPGGTFPGQFRTGIPRRLPDGRVLVSPHVEASVSTAFIHDVNAGTVVAAPHCGGVFTPQLADGSYLGCPISATSVPLKLTFNRTLHTNTRLSPHYNHI